MLLGALHRDDRICCAGEDGGSAARATWRKRFAGQAMAWYEAGAALGPRTLVVAVVAMVAAWTALAWRYPVFSLLSNPRFSLGKVEPVARLVPDVLLFVLLFAAYLWGYVSLRRAPGCGRMELVAVAMGALVAGAAALVLYPVGARDVFHYLMALDIAAKYRANPYVVLYSSLPRDAFATYGFLPNTPLGYGPGWLAFYLLPAPLAGFTSVLRTLLVYKGFNLLLILGAAAAIYCANGGRRGRNGLPGAYLLALNPLVLFEGVANGHNDVLMALLMVVAIVALRRRWAVSLALVVLASSVKFYPAPVALVFAYYMVRQRWPARRLVFSALLATLAAAAVVAPFWANGAMIQGLKDGGLVYMRDLYSCSLLSLARQVAVEGGLASARDVEVGAGVALLAATASVLWASRRCQDPTPAAAVVLGWSILLATNLLPWYLVTLLAVVTLSDDATSLTYLLVGTLLGMLYYFVTIVCWSTWPSDPLNTHLVEACFLTLPLLTFVVRRCLALARGCGSADAPA